MKNVCFLVSEHPFLDSRIFKKEAKSLLKQGYNVTMIVPRKDGYLFDVDGSIFENRFLSQQFTYEGIKIVTYEQIYPEKQMKKLYHNLHSGSEHQFTDSLTQLGILEKADIYHAHEFYSLYSGIGIKRALTKVGKQCKVIYDSHELDVDPLVVQAKNIIDFKTKMLKLMLKETDYVITVSESIKTWFLSIDSHPPIEVIYNSPPLAIEYEAKQANKPGLLLAYEGVISQKRVNFKKIVNILELCNKAFDLKVKIIGGRKSNNNQELPIPPHLKDKIEFTGWVNYQSIPNVMKDVDLGWVDLDVTSSMNNQYAMPNKFFSYLNNGVPVLVNECKDMESFINQHKCGCVVKKLEATAKDYSHALMDLHANRSKIRDMGFQARKIMESAFSWEHMEKRLYAVYNQLFESN
ncbi:glycosyltransferase [Oceanobacillus bengalensis]|uniref:Glycosyltransferase n=1 Tax=Oceanobacillus bengalensis TaxID=1435466 RepID=A0A494Z547_9BACI|nr:glycosyltransferase [Oceanobacillus bengalensis]